MSQGAGAVAPIQPPPPGTPVYGGLGPDIVGVSIALGVVATIVLAIRIYTAFFIVKNKLTWSLVSAIVAWSLGVPSAVLYALAAKYGLGNHIYIAAFSPDLPTAIFYEWIAACTISWSVWFGKLSAVLFILQVQGKAYSNWRWLLFVILGINFICYVITVVFIFTECEPVQKLWDAALPGVCNGSFRAYAWAVWTGAWGCLTDAVIALYPVTMIVRLQISTRLKITLGVLLGLGLFTAICSLVKTVQFGDLNATTDATYEIARLMIWGITEMWVVLIASSMAPIWPWMRNTHQYLSSISGRALRSIGRSGSSGNADGHLGNGHHNNSSSPQYSGFYKSGMPKILTKKRSWLTGGRSKRSAKTIDSISMESGIHLTQEITVHSEHV